MVVINAAGAWVDNVRAFKRIRAMAISLTKGIHIVVDREKPSSVSLF